MSSTRKAAPGSDPLDHPHREQSHPALRMMDGGLQLTANVVSILPREERDAMIWLHRYATLRAVPVQVVANDLDMNRDDMRRCLFYVDVNRSEFIGKVKRLRKRFEAELDSDRRPDIPSPFRLPGKMDESLCRIATNRVSRKIANAVQFAQKSPQICECIGKWQLGKSTPARHEFLKMIDRAAYVHCPGYRTERDFIRAMGEALGVSIGTSQKACQITPKIEACFGPDGIRVLFIDEGHRLWPGQQSAEAKRPDYLRDLWELHGVSVVIISTPQYDEQLTDAVDNNSRWAAGQWLGRCQYFPLIEALSHDELEGIARRWGPDVADDGVEQLVQQAMSSHGYSGAMVRAIQRAREMTNGDHIDLDTIKRAQKQLQYENRARKIVNPVGRPRKQ